MKLQRWNVVGALVVGVGLSAIGAGTGGCTASASGGVGGGSGSGGVVVVGDLNSAAGCTADSSLSCTGGAFGVSCTAQTSPDQGNYQCSEPETSSGNYNYCCIDYTGTSTCTPDDSVTCSDGYGYTCSGSDAPSDGDSSLNCSVPGGTGSQYCCTDQGSGSSSGGSGSSSGGSGSCAADTTLQCDAGSDGYTCTDGAAISSDDPTFICSDPTTNSDGSQGYCCATSYSGGTCTQDDSVTGGCAYPSIGFTCTGSDSPSDADSSLTCSVPGGNGMQFCCQ